MLAIVLNELNHWFSLRWVAYQVKRNVDVDELQQGPTNLLADHRGDLRGYQDFYGTNMPSGLKKVYNYSNVQIWN
jgi:hypothetical protein